MEIIIGRGLGSLVLGMSSRMVKNILGEPDRINTDERDGFVVYYYNKIMTRLFFCVDQEEILHTIDTYHKDTYLWDQKVIGKSMTEIEMLLKENNINTWEIEDYDFYEVIFCEEIWSIFCFEYDKLISIEFSIISDEDGNLIWPM